MSKRARYLLFLMPLALLGAALLLVRARLPRPQTAGDQWLWSRAEIAPSLDISFGDAGAGLLQQAGFTYHPSALRYDQSLILEIRDRQGVRDVLRALEGTPAFQRGKTPFKRVTDLNHACLALLIAGRDETLFVTQEARGSFVYRGEQRAWAPIKQQSITRFAQALKTALARAKQQEPGYRLHTYTAQQVRWINARLRPAPTRARDHQTPSSPH